MKGWQKGSLLIVLSLLILLLGLASLTAASPEGKPYSELFEKNCMTCHALNDQGQVSRVDFMRKTPEGWEDTIVRMQRLWGVNLTREEVRELVVELSEKQGLAPEESSPVLYNLAQQRSIVEELPDNEAVIYGCVGACHSFAKIASQRRTADEWNKVKDFHLATNPGITLQMRSMDWPTVADEAISYLAEKLPLETEEYQAWQNLSQQPVEGEWAIVGTMPGKGNYSGKLTLIKEDDINYIAERQVTYLNGETERWLGNGVLFDGYSLRASMANGDEKFRLVALLADQVGVVEGSWRHVADSGLKGEEVYVRIDQEAKLLGASKIGLIAGTEDNMQLWGTNIPAGLTKDKIAVTGSGVEITDVVQATSESVTVQVKVDSDIAVGSVAMAIEGVAGTVAVNVGQAEYIKVYPEYGVSRLGGIAFPKQGLQFEAIAYATGTNGVEISLGPVQVDWTLEPAEELPYEDDVLRWVGTMDQNGYFTPGLDGPNPERPLSTNNAGALIVNAAFNVPGTDQVLNGSAQLLVTVPAYREID